MEVKGPQGHNSDLIMEVREPQSGSIQINGSDGASIRDIIQINEVKGPKLGTNFLPWKNRSTAREP